MLLSVGGEDILLKAVIQSILAYAMSMFWLPKGLVQKTQHLCARFRWGGNEEKRKLHWCNWNTLCKDKFVGGLGFKNLVTFNRALLAKLGWRILKYPDALAVRVLKGCYFTNDDFLEAGSKPSDSYVWKCII
ncbi:hypothetical protein Ddye_000386 [Dipteronia dyeriana]|uniref:Reverse transcriptase n=1 Tax=Dipteronia dyeriana TaxID=168575 RepID=A0AAE0CSH5_9ROSI|nr:hypothetical protein Ddye_000386 [Dipteronia dyeriana]